MRLTPAQRQWVPRLVRRHFGLNARVWLFGSRVNDRARGGDFDFLVRCDDLSPIALVQAKLNLMADLHDTPDFEGERLDVVLYSTQIDPQPRPIHQVALNEGVELKERGHE
jgi:predicted nucleotidyltransferase